ncbi:hypothetical protein DL96DRAFT_588983 [Flagelloscypha sp. PMI_526]|nr:hypothetical protein DL96DRAFT_588983 [Flagelloscypha sp. PMI_526]
MPFAISASSNCDVCLSQYDCTNTAEHERVIPAVIPCGHVLCLACLQRISPRVCPLCRQRFSADQVRKIHADSVDQPPNDSQHIEQGQAYRNEPARPSSTTSLPGRPLLSRSLSIRSAPRWSHSLYSLMPQIPHFFRSFSTPSPSRPSRPSRSSSTPFPPLTPSHSLIFEDENPGIVAIAVWDFDALEDFQINLHNGDLVVGIDTASDEWWRGSVQRAGNWEHGFFPADHVEVQNE